MSKFDCKKCQQPFIEELVKRTEMVFSNGSKHIRIDCFVCGSFLGYLPQQEPRLYFGKYKSKTYAEVAREDTEYLHWLYGETTKKGLKEKINEALINYGEEVKQGN